MPKRTIQRDWARARAWLYKELYSEACAGDADLGAPVAIKPPLIETEVPSL